MFLVLDLGRMFGRIVVLVTLLIAIASGGSACSVAETCLMSGGSSTAPAARPDPADGDCDGHGESEPRPCDRSDCRQLAAASGVKDRGQTLPPPVEAVAVAGLAPGLAIPAGRRDLSLDRLPSVHARPLFTLLATLLL